MSSLSNAFQKACDLISPHSFVAVLSQVTQMVCGFVVLRWVTPEQVGPWQALLLLEPYMGVLRLGIVNAMNRSYAYLLGAGQRQQALACVETTFSYTVFISVLEMFILGVGLFVWARGHDVWLAGAIVFCVYAPIGLFRNYLEATYRSSSDFRALSMVQMVTALFSIVSVLLVIRWGFVGYMIRLLLLQFGGTALCWYFRPVRVALVFHFAIFKKLMIDGFFLYINNWLTGVAGSFFRILLLQAGGSVLLGRFSPIAAVMAMGTMIPSTISVYLLPRLNFDFGSTKSSSKVVADSLRASLVGFGLMIPCIAAGCWVLPPLLQWIAPAYQVTPLSVRLALVITLFASYNLSVNAFTVLGKWGYMILNLILLLSASWLGPWLGIRYLSENPLEGALLGCLIATFVRIPVTTVLLRYSCRGLKKG